MKFVVIEGLDGSGKTTQVNLLKDYLYHAGIKYQYMHFPRTDTPVYGDMIARFLRGEFGPIDAVNPYLVALIYAGDRDEAKNIISGWLAEENLVLVDRYVYSNIAFQCAKLTGIQSREQLKDWILHLEFSYNKIPKPDLVLYLDVPFEFTKQNLSNHRQGSDRDYLKGNLDINENDFSFQEKVRQMYLWQSKMEPVFRVIDCASDKGNILPPGEIFHKIILALTAKNILL